MKNRADHVTSVALLPRSESSLLIQVTNQLVGKGINVLPILMTCWKHTIYQLYLFSCRTYGSFLNRIQLYIIFVILTRKLSDRSHSIVFSLASIDVKSGISLSIQKEKVEKEELQLQMAEGKDMNRIKTFIKSVTQQVLDEYITRHTSTNTPIDPSDPLLQCINTIEIALTNCFRNQISKLEQNFKMGPTDTSNSRTFPKKYLYRNYRVLKTILNDSIMMEDYPFSDIVMQHQSLYLSSKGDVIILALANQLLTYQILLSTILSKHNGQINLSSQFYPIESLISSSIEQAADLLNYLRDGFQSHHLQIFFSVLKEKLESFLPLQEPIFNHLKIGNTNVCHFVKQTLLHYTFCAHFLMCEAANKTEMPSGKRRSSSAELFQQSYPIKFLMDFLSFSSMRGQHYTSLLDLVLSSS